MSEMRNTISSEYLDGGTYSTLFTTTTSGFASSRGGSISWATYAEYGTQHEMHIHVFKSSQGRAEMTKTRVKSPWNVKATWPPELFGLCLNAKVVPLRLQGVQELQGFAFSSPERAPAVGITTYFERRG